MNELNEMDKRATSILLHARRTKDLSLCLDCMDVIKWITQRKNPYDIMLTGQWKNILHVEIELARDLPMTDACLNRAIGKKYDASKCLCTVNDASDGTECLYCSALYAEVAVALADMVGRVFR